MVIVSLTCVKPLDGVDTQLDAHVAYLQQEYANGSFVASGRKVPRTGGVILSNLKTCRELEAVLAKDPFSRAGIAEYEITEFCISMVAEGFENLQEQ